MNTSKLIIGMACTLCIQANAQEKPQPHIVTITDSVCDVKILELDFLYDSFDYENCYFLNTDFQMAAVCKNVCQIVFEVVIPKPDGTHYFWGFNVDDAQEGMTIKGDTILFKGLNYNGEVWDWGEHWRILFLHDYGNQKRTAAISDWMNTSDYVTDPEVRKACEEYYVGIVPVAHDENLRPIIENGVLYPNNQKVSLYSAHGLLLKQYLGEEAIPLNNLSKGVYLIKTNSDTIKINVK
ncbi:MAG: T9SS type A sorting domain-containing protein [Prevotella sp.]|nr:T9SS type A sorting domain-containing protein [Prevotella sp.]